MLNSKKTVSLGLAMAMAAAMAVPSFAADSNQTVMSGTYSEPAIAVTVPATGTVSVNPYGLPVKIESSGASVTIKNMQLVSAPMTLRNDGEVSLDAYVTASTTVASGSNIEFAATDPNQDTTGTGKTKPTIFMQLEAVQSTKSGSGDSLEKGLIEEFGADATWTGVTPINFDENGAIANSTKLITLKEVDSTTGKYQAGSIAQVRLNGKVSEDPTTTKWATTDTFTTTIAFTFKCTPASTT
jgi:hypothetical protein